MKFIAKTLYYTLIVLGLFWFYVMQLPLLLTAGTLPALFGITIAVLIVAVIGQLVWTRWFKKDEIQPNQKENAP